MTQIASLSSRRVIALSGNDAEALLQRIITQDMALLAQQPVLFTALLSPQGKWQSDFFIFKRSDQYLIDVDHSKCDPLMRSLHMYKLRSDVTIDPASDTYAVQVAWDGDASLPTDPRLEALGQRDVVERTALSQTTAEETEYHQHRLAHGVPEGVLDATERNFALELGYDQLHGISFTKGCFVGQEPTARMHYRSILRKCLYQVRTDADALPEAGSVILADDKKVGEMRSSLGKTGLAQLKIDPVSTQSQSPLLTCEGVLLQASLPAYMQPKVATILQSET